MTYWLIVTTVENLQVIKEKCVVGISERNTTAFAEVMEGDKCVIYTRLEKKPAGKTIGPTMTGVFEVVSMGYGRSKIFQAPPARPSEIFPLRLKVKPASPFIDNAIPFKPLIDKLAFIKHKKHWGSYLQGRALIPLSEKDYRAIVSSLQKES